MTSEHFTEKSNWDALVSDSDFDDTDEENSHIFEESSQISSSQAAASTESQPHYPGEYVFHPLTRQFTRHNTEERKAPSIPFGFDGLPSREELIHRQKKRDSKTRPLVVPMTGIFPISGMGGSADCKRYWGKILDAEYHSRRVVARRVPIAEILRTDPVMKRWNDEDFLKFIQDRALRDAKKQFELLRPSSVKAPEINFLDISPDIYPKVQEFLDFTSAVRFSQVCSPIYSKTKLCHDSDKLSKFFPRDAVFVVYHSTNIWRKAIPLNASQMPKELANVFADQPHGIVFVFDLEDNISLSYEFIPYKHFGGRVICLQSEVSRRIRTHMKLPIPEIRSMTPYGSAPALVEEKTGIYKGSSVGATPPSWFCLLREFPEGVKKTMVGYKVDLQDLIYTPHHDRATMREKENPLKIAYDIEGRDDNRVRARVKYLTNASNPSQFVIANGITGHGIHGIDCICRW